MVGQVMPMPAALSTEDERQARLFHDKNVES
jgi:hypothetical protein